MGSKSEAIKERIKQVMLSDRVTQVETILASIRSDCIEVFSNYMSINCNEVDVVLEELGDGRYALNVCTYTDRLYSCGKMIASVD